MKPAEPPQTDRVIFVVHGVGAPGPDDALVSSSTLGRATPWAERIGASLELSQQLTSPKGEALQTRDRYSTIQGQVGGERCTFVDLEWADLSRTPKGFLAPLRAVLTLLFDLSRPAKAAGKATPSPKNATASGPQGPEAQTKSAGEPKPEGR
ncbi:MAG: hypothetical protein AAGM22_33165 [Acidobacteriota bacterium]